MITIIGNRHSTQVPHFDLALSFKFFVTTSLYCENHNPTATILLTKGRERKDDREGEEG